MRGETAKRQVEIAKIEFQSTPLMRGETSLYMIVVVSISFQSTPLMRGETNRDVADAGSVLYFNPLPSCEGRPENPYFLRDSRAYFNPLPSCEGRPRHARRLLCGTSISIHSPHARGDNAHGNIGVTTNQFQSTPLMRGETKQAVIQHSL